MHGVQRVVALVGQLEHGVVAGGGLVGVAPGEQDQLGEGGVVGARSGSGGGEVSRRKGQKLGQWFVRKYKNPAGRFN